MINRIGKLTSPAGGLSSIWYLSSTINRQIVVELLGEIEYGDIITRIKELEKKYEQLAREVGRIEKDLALLARRCSKS